MLKAKFTIIRSLSVVIALFIATSNDPAWQCISCGQKCSYHMLTKQTKNRRLALVKSECMGQGKLQ